MSQPFVLSTTHRLFGSGFSPLSIASFLVLFSSHLDLMCALYPYCLQRSSDGFQKYPLSKQRFSSISRGISETILRIISSPSTGESCLFAPVTHIDRGIPFPSHLRCLFVQFFPPIRWIWSNRFLCKRSFYWWRICTLPLPRYTFKLIKLSYSFLPEFSKKSSFHPFQEVPMNSTCTSVLFLWNCFPLNTCTKHKYNTWEYCTSIDRFSSSSWFTNIFLTWISFLFRNKRSYFFPESIRYFPWLEFCHIQKEKE